jgi:hypothetical protein
MPKYGYSLSSEEFGPNDLVRYERAVLPALGVKSARAA